MGQTGSKNSKKSKDAAENQSKLSQEPEEHSLKHNDNDSFIVKLAEQNSKNDKELKEKRENKRRKQKEFEEELQKLRMESKKRIEMLLMCILTKLKFEEQEQNWMDWILECRQSIIVLLNRWNGFVDEVETNYKSFRKPEKIDQPEFQRETYILLNSVMMAYNSLQFDFEHLQNVQNQFPDVVFVKVLMKCIADVAILLLNISDSLESMEPAYYYFKKLQNNFETLKPDLIYSTAKLRDVCKNWEDFDDVQFPKISQSAHVEFL